MKTKLLLFLALALGGSLYGDDLRLLADPPPEPGPTLLGVSRGEMDSYWVAPYVRVNAGLGGTNITWFKTDGQVKNLASVENMEPGFVWLGGPQGVIRGLNENWTITLPPESGATGYITGTPDSRVLVHEIHPLPGGIALEIYVHGKPVPDVGPFLQYEGRDVDVNDDGSTALLIWKDAAHTAAQIVAAGTNGDVRFRVNCGLEVDGPLVAPDGAGVLVHPNTGGTDENTFLWYTVAGKQVAVDINPNPYCLGWVPGSRQSLFSTEGGEAQSYRLIDWNTGKCRWNIASPTAGTVLAVGLTAGLIFFDSAELYQAGSWRGAEWPVQNGSKEWIRTFQAVSVQDGSVVARWRAKTPQRLTGEERDHFLALGDRFYFVTAGEYVELNPEDALLKKNGWQ
jgi:hypothetical protein